MPEDRLLTAAKVVFGLGLLFGFVNFQNTLDPRLAVGVLLGLGLVSGVLAAVRVTPRRALQAAMLPLLGFALTFVFC